MTNPLVTVGVPVYRGQDTLPVLLECLRTQSYRDIDVLISVDNADHASAEACEPFLQEGFQISHPRSALAPGMGRKYQLDHAPAQWQLLHLSAA